MFNNMNSNAAKSIFEESEKNVEESKPALLNFKMKVAQRAILI